MHGKMNGLVNFILLTVQVTAMVLLLYLEEDPIATTSMYFIHHIEFLVYQPLSMMKHITL